MSETASRRFISCTPQSSIAFHSDLDNALVDEQGRLFERLDFIYTPSTDVAADVRYFVEVLGATLVFAIDDGGTRVAMVQLTNEPPQIVLNDHVEGERPILMYRVDDLAEAVHELSARGWKSQRGIELPMGPARTFTSPGGQRVALYESTRPGVIASFAGRHDFS